MSRGCQWISGDPRRAAAPGADEMKCGAPVVAPGRSYCAVHHRVAYARHDELRDAVAAMDAAVRRLVGPASPPERPSIGRTGSDG